MTDSFQVRIAIDGHAGSGKSTIGQGVARVLRYPYLDTGLMYRAVTFLAIQRGIDVADEGALIALAQAQEFQLLGCDETGINVSGVVMGRELHSPAIDQLVSPLAAHGGLRSLLVRRQRELAQQSIVMVGRDIGTVVIPDADVKLWITASPEVRAQRRQMQRGDRDQIEAGMVRGALEARDQQDETRAVAPLRRAEDALVIATDNQTPEQSVAQAVEIIRRRVR